MGKRNKNYKKPVKRKSSTNGSNKKINNYKYQQRGKKMEATYLKQKQLMDEYTTKTYVENVEFDEVLENIQENEQNDYEDLLTSLKSDKRKILDIQSTSEEESDEESVENNDYVDDDRVEIDDDEVAVDDDVLDDDLVDDVEVDDDLVDDDEVADDYNVDDDDDIDDEGSDDEDNHIDMLPRVEQEAFKIEDIFYTHLNYELSIERAQNIKNYTSNTIEKKLFKWPNLGNFIFELNKDLVEKDIKFPAYENSIKLLTNKNDLLEMRVDKSLIENITLKPLQSEIFTILNNYQDVYYPEVTNERLKDICMVYSLHALNHIKKTRSLVMKHNAKIKNAETQKSKIDKNLLDNFRDQGLTRPKVLIIVPFRNSALNIIENMIKILYGNKEDECKKNGTIINYTRFESDFGGHTISFPKHNPKPEDYEKTFSGNTDDNFRIGLSLTKKCMKLYTDFYTSDIIITSPLGLRLVIGAPGSKIRDYDFLNSIEVLIIDQAQVLYAQNWENVQLILDHLHLQPQSMKNINFQRVRDWCLSGLSKFYRQTILLCSHELIEFRAVANSKCYNYRGKVRVTNPQLQLGYIQHIIVKITQVFCRIDVNDYDSSFDRRFEYFTKVILPKFKNSSGHCLVYIPSYFDFVRIRNYAKAESLSVVQICEYTKVGKMNRARDIFYHSGAQFLLYTERSHFFRRSRLKGIRNLIIYQPPSFPNFYSEIVNFMHSTNQNNRDGLENSMTVTILYTKYDSLQLNGMVGSALATNLVKSEKSCHAIRCD